MACVYSLSSSLEPDVVRYIGRANTDDGATRLREHIRGARRGDRSHKYSWLRKVVADGGEVVSSVLESGLSWEASGEREIFHIAHHRRLGGALTNMTDGGDGVVGQIRSAETRAKLSASKKGIPLSAVRLANLIAVHKGSTYSAESRAKMSAWQVGRTLTPEHRANLSISAKARRVREKEAKNQQQKEGKSDE